jgi:hypothetical protein
MPDLLSPCAVGRCQSRRVMNTSSGLCPARRTNSIAFASCPSTTNIPAAMTPKCPLSRYASHTAQLSQHKHPHSHPGALYSLKTSVMVVVSCGPVARPCGWGVRCACNAGETPQPHSQHSARLESKRSCTKSDGSHAPRQFDAIAR